jgi:hypothetical protein
MKSLGALLILSVFSTQAVAASCDMKLAFSQPDDGGRTKVPVWESASPGTLFFGSSLHVNTDGTRRSYSVDDFWGKSKAINNLCNAMSDACAGLSSAGLAARRRATEEARDRGWPSAAFAATRLSPSIIPLKRGKPCPETDGFLMSATALQNPSVGDVCSPEKYVDALAVPALVIPKRAQRKVATPWEQRNTNVGDLAAVMSPDGSKLIFAVVGDKGPARELGEASVALNGALLGKNAAPANYDEVRGRGQYAGKGWDVNRALILIFSGTRSDSSPYLTREAIDKKGQELLNNWGGIEKLKACRDAYSR